MKKSVKTLLSILILLETIVVITDAILNIFEIETDYNGASNCSCLAIIIALLLNKRNVKKKYYRLFLEKKMDTDTILGLLGKNVTIRTLDEYISGTVKSTDGDFIIVDKKKKNSVEKTFINKNAIQTIKIK